MTAHFSSLALFSAIAGLAAVMALYAWTSRINRFFFFARTLPAAFSATEPARVITRRYIGCILIGGGLAILVTTALYVLLGRTIISAIAGGVVIEIVASHLAFAYAHRTAGAAYGRYVSALSPSAVRNDEQHAIAVPLLNSPAKLDLRVLLAPILFALSLFFGGFATSNSTLSAFTDAVGAQGGALLLGMGCGMLLAGTAMRLLLHYSARHRTQMASYIGQVMAGLSWLAALMIGGIVIATRLHRAITRTTAHTVMAAFFIVVAVHLVYLWSRNNQFAPSPAEQNGDHHWRAGLFYYNRQDPALFVQRRNGPGYTFNFGNHYSWLITALVIADPIFLLMNQHHF